MVKLQSFTIQYNEYSNMPQNGIVYFVETKRNEITQL